MFKAGDFLRVCNFTQGWATPTSPSPESQTCSPTKTPSILPLLGDFQPLDTISPPQPPSLQTSLGIVLSPYKSSEEGIARHAHTLQEQPFIVFFFHPNLRHRLNHTNEDHHHVNSNTLVYFVTQYSASTSVLVSLFGVRYLSDGILSLSGH